MFLSKSVGVLTVLTLAVGIVAAQDSMPRYRTFISDTTLPGIDTGIRDKDAPRPPRPYPTDVVARSSGEPPTARKQPVSADDKSNTAASRDFVPDDIEIPLLPAVRRRCPWPKV